MLFQVAKLFLFRNWFAIIGLWSLHLLETIASISSCGVWHG